MRLFCADRLAIGTANWKLPYGTPKHRVPDEEWHDILDFCQCNGIDMLDTSVAYNTVDIGNTYFRKVIKVKQVGSIKEAVRYDPYCIMAHGTPNIKQIRLFWNGLVGASIYSPAEIPQSPIDVIQVPYNLYDRRFEPYFADLKKRGVEIHVRSVFLQGKLLEAASPFECISFCLMNPCVDRLILGVDSLKQLQMNLGPFFKMSRLQTDDESIIDPRKW